MGLPDFSQDTSGALCSWPRGSRCGRCSRCRGQPWHAHRPPRHRPQDQQPLLRVPAALLPPGPYVFAVRLVDRHATDAASRAVLKRRDDPPGLRVRLLSAPVQTVRGAAAVRIAARAAVVGACGNASAPPPAAAVAYEWTCAGLPEVGGYDTRTAPTLRIPRGALGPGRTYHCVCTVAHGGLRAAVNASVVVQPSPLVATIAGGNFTMARSGCAPPPSAPPMKWYEVCGGAPGVTFSDRPGPSTAAVPPPLCGCTAKSKRRDAVWPSDHSFDGQKRNTT